jgi:ABC-type dipeptide/oligopeptide/nickel transport system permease subunit
LANLPKWLDDAVTFIVDHMLTRPGFILLILLLIVLLIETTVVSGGKGRR